MVLGSVSLRIVIPWGGWAVDRQQPYSVTIEDQIFDQVQAFDLMNDAGCETRHRRKRAHRIFVGCVA
jgi:hypothetical protein